MTGSTFTPDTFDDGCLLFEDTTIRFEDVTVANNIGSYAIGVTGSETTVDLQTLITQLITNHHSGNAFLWNYNQSSNDSVSISDSTFDIDEFDHVAYMTSQLSGHEVVVNFNAVTFTKSSETILVWTSDDDDTEGYIDANIGDIGLRLNVNNWNFDSTAMFGSFGSTGAPTISSSIYFKNNIFDNFFTTSGINYMVSLESEPADVNSYCDTNTWTSSTINVTFTKFTYIAVTFSQANTTNGNTVTDVRSREVDSLSY